ncbi:ankyrin repeat-containing domain protein [Coniochaeta sp. 2T2.1]|nr:ankyrin repeat-containing domain protein [Coniochaeta sp. 2T2.1]
MADPDISGTTLTAREKDRILQLATQGRTSNLREVLQSLAETKGRTVGQLILEARDGLGLGITHRAAETNKHAVIEMICEDLGFPPGTRLAVLNDQGPAGRTAASIAAETNSDAVLRALILGGASMLITDFFHSLPIHRAAMYQNTLAMNVLLALAGPANVGINVQTASGQTALHLALSRGDTMRAGYLIRCGANVELQTAAGDTALHLSIPLWTQDNDDRAFNAMMHAYFMRIIDAPGSGPNGKANLRIPNNGGRSAGDIALETGQLKAFNLIRAFGG